MLTFEDVTGYFLKAAAEVSLTAHPEYWVNARSMEREFACTCHIGTCDEAENASVCTLSFSWSSMDTALSLEGPAGVCDFFHEPGEDCPHLHTRDIPPLVLDLSYMLMLKSHTISEETLLSLMQMLKLRASEHSSRTIETRPGISMVLHEHRLQPEALTLQQRVELPIWHPDGMRGLHDEPPSYSERITSRRQREGDDERDLEIIADAPRPEEWLPQVLVEVCHDITQVLESFSTVCEQGHVDL